MYDPKASLEKAFSQIKRRHLAEKLGITAQAISQWEKTPVQHVLKIESMTGVPRHELRPDIYPEPDAAT